MRGSTFAAIGSSLIVYAGVRLSPESLAIWGPWLFGIGMFLIAAGLIPYRRLNALQENPDQIIIDPKALHLKTKGRMLFSLPLRSIAKVTFINDPKPGMGICLAEPIPEKIQVHCKRFSMEAFQKRNRRACGHPLFFPYFTEASCKELQEVLQIDGGG